MLITTLYLSVTLGTKLVCSFWTCRLQRFQHYLFSSTFPSTTVVIHLITDFLLQCRCYNYAKSGTPPAAVQLMWKYLRIHCLMELQFVADYIAGRKTVLLTADQVSAVSSSRNCLKIAVHQHYICLHLIFKTNMPTGASYLTLTQHERWAWKWQQLCTLYQAETETIAVTFG